jgi:hypothetical protein
MERSMPFEEVPSINPRPALAFQTFLQKNKKKYEEPFRMPGLVNRLNY